MTTALIRHTGRPVLYPQPHDPDTTVWYVMIWDEALADQVATIEGGSWAITPAPSDPPEAGDMTIDAEVIGSSATIGGVTYAQTTAVKISGGTVDEIYTLTCTVQTDAGETLQKSFILHCDQQ